MSVWGTFLAFDEDHAESCAVWVNHDGWSEMGGAPCDCGLPSAPWRYQGSHILPSPDDQRGGSVQLAEIPPHIARDGRDDGPDDGVTPWPWLRLSVGQEDAVLDEALARQLRDALDGWLRGRAEAR